MLHYFDRASMAHSLEVRVPFLDHRVVEYCATVPSELKVRRLRTKHLLKEAARGLVPDHVIDKRKIGFFRGSVEAGSALRADQRDARPSARSRRAVHRVPRSRRRQTLVRDHPAGEATGQLLLSILMLEVWLREYLPRALSAGKEAQASSA